MAVLEIVAPGALTTVQDLGRLGHLSAGVPPSGALDPVALRLANHLAGNDEAAAGLEVLHAGPEFRVLDGPVRVATAWAGLEILEPEPWLHPAWQSVTLPPEARVRMAPLRSAACAYLSVFGGIAVPKVLGSASTYTRAGLGGFHGRMLRAGDRLEVGDADPRGAEQALAVQPGDSPAEAVIRVVMGPQQDCFTAAGIETFLGSAYSISPSSDRMGARLDGPDIALRSHEGFISDGITAGAVQVPSSGQAIVLLADHQTTGGYPKIATVISADLPPLGRLRPGAALRFQPVDVPEAVRLRRALEDEVGVMIRSIGNARSPVRIDLERLQSANLISGVVDATQRWKDR